MDNTQFNNTGSKDEALWKIAKRRAGFKRHLLNYLVINALIWGIWFFNGYRTGNYVHIWPIWVTLGWGIGIFFDYINSYWGVKESLEEKEYQKLINKQ
jgi:hypothetical protein